MSVHSLRGCWLAFRDRLLRDCRRGNGSPLLVRVYAEHEEHDKACVIYGKELKSFRGQNNGVFAQVVSGHEPRISGIHRQELPR